jgi:hypothetical protein
MQGADKAPASPALNIRRLRARAPGMHLGAQRARVVAQAPARGRERGGGALQALLRLLRGLDEEQVARLRLRERLQQLPRLLGPGRGRSGQDVVLLLRSSRSGAAGRAALRWADPAMSRLQDSQHSGPCTTMCMARCALSLACAMVDAGQQRQARREQPDKSAPAVRSLSAVTAPGSTWRPADPARPAAAGARAAAGPAPRARPAAPPTPTWQQPPPAPLPA